MGFYFLLGDWGGGMPCWEGDILAKIFRKGGSELGRYFEEEYSKQREEQVQRT